MNRKATILQMVAFSMFAPGGDFQEPSPRLRIGSG